MSKHVFSQHNSAGQELKVELGYDNPLSQFYINIWCTQGQMVFNSLAEPAEDQDAVWLVTILAKHGLVIPLKALQQLGLEAMLGGSNGVVAYGHVIQTDTDTLLLRAGFRQVMPNVLPMRQAAIWCWVSDKRDMGAYRLLKDDDYEVHVPDALMPIPNGAEAKSACSRQEINDAVSEMQGHLVERLGGTSGECQYVLLKEALGFAPLPKPLTFEQLRAKVTQLLDGKPTGTTLLLDGGHFFVEEGDLIHVSPGELLSEDAVQCDTSAWHDYGCFEGESDPFAFIEGLAYPAFGAIGPDERAGGLK